MTGPVAITVQIGTDRFEYVRDYLGAWTGPGGHEMDAFEVIRGISERVGELKEVTVLPARWFGQQMEEIRANLEEIRAHLAERNTRSDEPPTA